MSKLSIVVPCYNESEVLPQTIPRLLSILDDLVAKQKISADSALYFVDDGSSDNTWTMIKEYSAKHSNVHGIKLSRNQGHQNAVLAGMLHVNSDAVISVDADLQDDLNAIESMIDKFHEGNDIVYGVRDSRATDTFFKRFTAKTYYRLLSFMGVDIVFNHADYRLMSLRAVNALREYGESNLFLRGIIPTIGFPSAKVSYDRAERAAGISKYPLKRMLALAIDGITSFSAVPLRIIAILGLFLFVGSLVVSIWVLWVRFVNGDAVPGWASSVLPIYFLGGVQLLSLGVIGEYVAKMYMETKRRPRYFIEESI